MRRHAAGDWGDLDAHERRVNERALLTGGRLLSAYWLGAGARAWVITEADHSTTTLLLPEEYGDARERRRPDHPRARHRLR